MAADSQRPPRAPHGSRPRDDGDLRRYFESARPELDAPANLDVDLRAALDAARAAWPEIELSDEIFVRFVAGKLPDGAGGGAALAALRTDELYLTCAGARGDVRALAGLERLCASAVDRALSRSGPAAKQRRDDLRQHVHERLLAPRVAPDGGALPPRIAEFSGRGPLGAWLQVVAVRALVDLSQREQRQGAQHDEDALAAACGDDNEPELAFLKRLYRDEFRVAFREALEALSRRERTLLRQHALDGLTVDRLAVLYKVHRATAARWVDAARRAVLEHTRLGLGRRLRVSADELDSVMRLVQSQLDVTLSALWRDRDEPTSPGGSGGEGTPPA